MTSLLRLLQTAMFIAAALWVAPLAASGVEQTTDAERAAFREEVRAYLLENPEVLMEAIAVLEQRQAASQTANDAALIAANAQALFDDGYSHVTGNPDGDVTVVEFVDYRCGYCRRAFPEVKELLATDGNIRLILKEFPILGEESVLSSRFAISTQLLLGDVEYARMHDALMTLRGDATKDSLIAVAESLGLDGAAILAGIADPRVDGMIAGNHALAQRLQISGTPTFVLPDRMLRGYLPLDGMRQVVGEVRAAAGD